MKLAIISGSHRKNSQSEKISKYLIKELSLKFSVSTYLLSLSENPIPLMDEDFFNPEDPNWKKVWQPISSELQSCDGIIIISPEWHGMVPAGLKNLLLLSSAKEFGHKPGLIVSVSAGISGSYPVNELRTSGFKNSRLCYIPEHLIIRDCTHVLNFEAPENPADESIRSRITYALNILLEYSKALKLVRESDKIDHKTFPNGM
ncbi:NADPH-dependent oxidoreductase [Silvanigrella paludirubra]|uniref:NADPH-dependent oxidoreductase n=1 Tax=Silvanigrella paludirubra TaxID=2499159 RepID=A0A6N6VR38_9BACT|nr:NAD(P)H-dependent oxidoreductase [Silvanigrella paludirubra]KAB8037822.1 NADPH-dependent oxidoreductase [Silvanigrella paludirubra]